MKIIIDKDIPFIEGVFEPFAEVIYSKGAEIDNKMVLNADALIIRTRTKCNEQLLKGSSIKIIASATIGKDHVDLEYCKNNNIKFVNAAGCNAMGVMQYVFTALYGCNSQNKSKNSIDLNSLYKPVKERVKLGVIGVGNVGSKVAAMGEYLGFEVLRNDPIKEREQTLAFNRGELHYTEIKDYYSLEYLLENSDIITLHVYLDSVTNKMANSEFFSKLKEGAIFINSSRGEVVDEQALISNINKLAYTIIDVWNNEPNISQELLNLASIATPHMAGYSFEGKINGTQMVIRDIAQHFNIKELYNYSVPDISPNLNSLNLQNLEEEQIAQKLLEIFPIFEESEKLKSNPDKFEQLRNNYNYRREFYVNRK